MMTDNRNYGAHAGANEAVGKAYSTAQIDAPTGPITATHDTLRDAADLAKRVEALRERLIGAPKTDQAGLGGTPMSVSVFDDLRWHSASVAQMLHDAHAALDAIDRALS